jgi:hypothetical protein
MDEVVEWFKKHGQPCRRNEMRSTIVIEHDEKFDYRKAAADAGIVVVADAYGLDAKARADRIFSALRGLPEDADGSWLEGFEWAHGKY